MESSFETPHYYFCPNWTDIINTIFKNLFLTPLRRRCINLHVFRLLFTSRTWEWENVRLNDDFQYPNLTIKWMIFSLSVEFVQIGLISRYWDSISVLKMFYLILLFRSFCHHKLNIKNVHEYYDKKFQNGKISSVASVCIWDVLMKRNLCRDQKILVLRARIIFLIFSTKVLSDFRSSLYPDKYQWCPSHELSWIVKVQIPTPYTETFR